MLVSAPLCVITRSYFVVITFTAFILIWLMAKFSEGAAHIVGIPSMAHSKVIFLVQQELNFSHWISFSIDHLKKKRRPLYLKTHSVPRCKHFSSPL